MLSLETKFNSIDVPYNNYTVSPTLYLSVILMQLSRWLFASGKLQKKYDYFHCFDETQEISSPEEMKPMRAVDANETTYPSCQPKYYQN